MESESTVTNDGGQAFPMSERDDALRGMTLRDYFAAKALQGLLANAGTIPAQDAPSVAVWAFDYADAMLKAREA